MDYNLFHFDEKTKETYSSFIKARNQFKTAMQEAVKDQENPPFSADTITDIFFFLEYRSGMSEEDIRKKAEEYRKVFTDPDPKARGDLLDYFYGKMEATESQWFLKLFPVDPITIHPDSIENLGKEIPAEKLNEREQTRLIRYFIAAKAAYTEQTVLREHRENTVYRDHIGKQPDRKEHFDKKSDFLRLHAYHATSLIAENGYPLEELFPEVGRSVDPELVNRDFQRSFREFYDRNPEWTGVFFQAPPEKTNAELFAYDPRKVWSRNRRDLEDKVRRELPRQYEEMERNWDRISDAVLYSNSLLTKRTYEPALSKIDSRVFKSVIEACILKDEPLTARDLKDNEEFKSLTKTGQQAEFLKQAHTIQKVLRQSSDFPVVKQAIRFRRLALMEAGLNRSLSHSGNLRSLKYIKEKTAALCARVDSYLKNHPGNEEELFKTYPLPLQHTLSSVNELNADPAGMTGAQKKEFYLKKALIGLQIAKAQERQNFLELLAARPQLLEELESKDLKRLDTRKLAHDTAKYCRLQQQYRNKDFDQIFFERFPEAVKQETESTLSMFMNSVIYEHLGDRDAFDKLSLAHKADFINRHFGRLILTRDGYIDESCKGYREFVRKAYINDKLSRIGEGKGKTPVHQAIDVFHKMYSLNREKKEGINDGSRAPVTSLNYLQNRKNGVSLSFDITYYPVRKSGKVSRDPVTEPMTEAIINKQVCDAIRKEQNERINLDPREAFAGLFRLELGSYTDAGKLTEDAFVYERETVSDQLECRIIRKDNIHRVLEAIMDPSGLPRRTNRQKFTEIYDAWQGFLIATNGSDVTLEDHQKFMEALEQVKITNVALQFRGKAMQEAYAGQCKIFTAMQEDLNKIRNSRTLDIPEVRHAEVAAKLRDEIENPKPLQEDALCMEDMIRYPEDMKKRKVEPLKPKLYTRPLFSPAGFRESSAAKDMAQKTEEKGVPEKAVEKTAAVLL